VMEVKRTRQLAPPRKQQQGTPAPVR
jgi:hypothetical protein